MCLIKVDNCRFDLLENTLLGYEGNNRDNKG